MSGSISVRDLERNAFAPSTCSNFNFAWTLPIVGFSGCYCIYMYSKVLVKKIKSSGGKLEEEEEKLGKHSVPYGRFSHPHRCFFDKFILGSVLPMLVPFTKIIAEKTCQSAYQSPCDASDGDNDDDDGKKTKTASVSAAAVITSKVKEVNKPLLLLPKLRESFIPIPPPKSWTEQIQKSSRPDDFLVGGTVRVPRKPELVRDNIPSQFTQHAFNDVDPMVKVEVTCPRSALVEKESNFNLMLDENGTKMSSSKDGFCRFVTCDLSQLKFVPSAQLLIYFHGGGFVIGEPRDFHEQFLCKQLTTTSTEGGGSGSNGDEEMNHKMRQRQENSPLVMLSVNYRLAPENPFPAAIIDAMSVTSFVMEQFPQCNIHICGCSAGANLAAVAYFECRRRMIQMQQQMNKDKNMTTTIADADAQNQNQNNHYNCSIKSLVVIDPFLEPTASSVSYHMNSKQPYINTAFLRWCWASYLQLNPGDEKDIDYESESSYGDAWNASQWCDAFRNQPEVGRYVRPDLDFHLGNVGCGKIIITTSMADPLEDEGMEFYKKIQEASKDCPGSDVCHFSGRGSHGFSLMMDSKAKEEFGSAFRKLIWNE